MKRYQAVLLLTAVAAQAGCDCFRNEALYRPVPRPVPARSTTGVVARAAADGDAGFAAASGMPGGVGSTIAGTITPSVPERLDATDPLTEHRALWTGGAAYAPLDVSPAESTPQQAAYRDPQKAFCLACLIAGGGHFYTGETTKGAVLLGVAAAGLIGGAVLSSGGGEGAFGCEYELETNECEPDGSRTPLLVGAGIAAASWVYGIIDARPSAARVNARDGGRVGAAALEVRPVLDLRRRRQGVGLSFRVTW